MQQCRRDTLRELSCTSHSPCRPSRRIGLSSTMLGPSVRARSCAGMGFVRGAESVGVLGSIAGGEDGFLSIGLPCRPEERGGLRLARRSIPFLIGILLLALVFFSSPPSLNAFGRGNRLQPRVDFSS